MCAVVHGVMEMIKHRSLQLLSSIVHAFCLPEEHHRAPSRHRVLDWSPRLRRRSGGPKTPAV